MIVTSSFDIESGPHSESSKISAETSSSRSSSCIGGAIFYKSALESLAPKFMLKYPKNLLNLINCKVFNQKIGKILYGTLFVWISAIHQVSRICYVKEQFSLPFCVYS